MDLLLKLFKPKHKQSKNKMEPTPQHHQYYASPPVKNIYPNIEQFPTQGYPHGTYEEREEQPGPSAPPLPTTPAFRKQHHGLQHPMGSKASINGLFTPLDINEICSIEYLLTLQNQLVRTQHSYIQLIKETMDNQASGNRNTPGITDTYFNILQEKLVRILMTQQTVETPAKRKRNPAPPKSKQNNTPVVIEPEEEEEEPQGNTPKRSTQSGRRVKKAAFV